MSDPLETFSLRVEMSPSTGSLYVGEIKDYATIGGFILFRKPDDLRILGLDPMLGSTIFDMVSVGDMFRVSIPSRSRFIEGRNGAPPTSKNQMENLRPAAFLTALIIQPPELPTDITVLEEDTSERESAYILLIIRSEAGGPKLVRTLQFDRHSLDIVRQKTFDPAGAVVSDTNYSGWRPYNGVPFPSDIDIKRPQERYEVRLSVTTVRMNPEDITPDKFVLNQPPNSTLQRLSE